MLHEERNNLPYSECPHHDGEPTIPVSVPIVFNSGCLPWLLSCRIQNRLSTVNYSLNQVGSIIHNEVFNPLLSQQEREGSVSSIVSLQSMIEEISCLSSLTQSIAWLLRLPYKDKPPLFYDAILSVSFSLTFMGVWALSSPKLIDVSPDSHIHAGIWVFVDSAFVIVLAALSFMHRRMVSTVLMAKSESLTDGLSNSSSYIKAIDILAAILRLSEFYKLYWVTFVSLAHMGSSNHWTWFVPWVSGSLGALFWNNDADQRMSVFLHQLKHAWCEPMLYQDHDMGGYRLMLPSFFQWTAQTNRYYLSIYSLPDVQPDESDSWCNAALGYARKFYHYLCDVLFTVLDQSYLNTQDVLYSFAMAISTIGFSIAMSQFVALVIAVIYEHCLDHEVEVHQDIQSLAMDSGIFMLVFLGNLFSHMLIKANEIPKPSPGSLRQENWPESFCWHRFRQVLDISLLTFHSLVARSIPVLLAMDKMTGMSNKELSCDRLFPEGFGFLVIIVVILSNTVLDLVFPQDTLRQVMSQMTDTVPYLYSESRYALLSLPDIYVCQEEVVEYGDGRSMCRVLATP